MNDNSALPRLDAEVSDRLRLCSTATLTTQLFARGLHNTFLAGLLPLDTANARLVGEAFTLSYIPAREDLDVLDVFRDPDHPQRRAVESVGPGQVLVMDCRGIARAASLGGILATRLLRRGAAGIVADGGLRDTQDIRALGLPTFAGAPAPTTNFALHHAVDMQVPIGCAEVAITRVTSSSATRTASSASRASWHLTLPVRRSSRSGSSASSRPRSTAERRCRAPTRQATICWRVTSGSLSAAGVEQFAGYHKTGSTPDETRAVPGRQRRRAPFIARLGGAS